MWYETRAHIYNKHMLIAQDCVKFCERNAWQSFLVNNFADFPECSGVKFVQSFVAFGISNISY